MRSDMLIAYYSRHGNTRKIAELIKCATGADLFEIELVRSCTTDYDAVVAQAKTQIRSSFWPELESMPETDSYEVVFLGTPIWWHTMAPPLASFIEHFDLEKKTVVPFYTHCGGGGGKYEQDIIKMCQDSTVARGFGTYNTDGSDTTAKIDVWLNAMGFQFQT
ncbi:MAG: flavodoxin [Desulfobacterium sp.]